MRSQTALSFLKAVKKVVELFKDSVVVDEVGAEGMVGRVTTLTQLDQPGMNGLLWCRESGSFPDR